MLSDETIESSYLKRRLRQKKIAAIPQPIRAQIMGNANVSAAGRSLTFIP